MLEKRPPCNGLRTPCQFNLRTVPVGTLNAQGEKAMFNRILAALAAAALTMVAVSAGTLAAEPVEVTIVHFNDLDQMSEKKGRGGVARLASVIDSERARGGEVIVTFGGDAISPSLLSGLDQGAHIIDLFNQLGLTVMVMGNHEYDFGPDIARQRISEAEFPVLATNNLDPDGNIIEGAEESIMVEVGPFQIGIFGLTTQGTAVKSSPGNISFADPTEVAAAQSSKLREAGADLVVALAHTDHAEDDELIGQAAVDLLLSGDDHYLRTEYQDQFLFAESGSQAEWVTLIDLRLDEHVDGDDKEFVWSASYRVVDSAVVEPDTELAAAVAVYETRLGEELDVELGTTETMLDSRRSTVRGGEAAIANLFADAIRDATGADIAFMNGGGIRADRTYDPGTVLTRRDIQNELPFGNKTVVLEVSGQDIIDALENGFSQIENGSGRFMHVSGLQVEYDPSLPAGSRVKKVMHGHGPLDPAATLTLAVNDFVAGGGDGYAMLAERPRIVDEYAAVLMTVQVFNYISSRGSVGPAVEGRLQIVE